MGDFIEETMIIQLHLTQHDTNMYACLNSNEAIYIEYICKKSHNNHKINSKLLKEFDKLSLSVLLFYLT